MTVENNKINCLDYGFVRLVDSMGGDLSVVRAARVSYNEEWRAGEDIGSDARLIKYLKKHKHHTPFEVVKFTFEVKAPIFVFRQWHRHRTWTYNELSARYRELPEEVYMPDFRAQSKSNKQGSEGRVDIRQSDIIKQSFLDLYGRAFRAYRYALEKGVAREVARSILPLATYSHMFASTDLLNLMRFLSLRNDPHAQYEIRVYAEAMQKLASVVVPVCMAAWEEFGV